MFIICAFKMATVDENDVEIKKLCEMTIDDLKKDSRVSGFSLEKLKKLAKHIGLSSSQNRMDLVMAIRGKNEKKQQLIRHQQLNRDDSEDDDNFENDNRIIIRNQNSSSSSDNRNSIEENEEDEDDESEDNNDGEDNVNYRKDKNTIPRLINILFMNQDAVARSHLLATRIQLQNGEVYDKQKIFVDSMESFNDRNFNSGGLIAEHTVFTERGINPENIGNGDYDSKKAWTHFKAVRRAYATALIKYEASGQHSNDDFFKYCLNDADVLYLYFALQKAGNPEISAFMQEGSVIRGGLDTSMGLNSSSDSDRSSKSSKRSSNNETQLILKELVAGQNRTFEQFAEERAVTKRAYGAMERESLIKSLSTINGDIDKLYDDIEVIERLSANEISENTQFKLNSKRIRLDDLTSLYNDTKDKLASLT